MLMSISTQTTFWCTGCGGAVTAPSGEIHSPQYPNNYPDNADCSWTITVDAGHRVFFNFTDLHVENHNSCDLDYVAVSAKFALDKCITFVNEVAHSFMDK